MMFRTVRTVTLLAVTGLAVAGCSSVSSMNPFAEKDTKLSGQRQPVFPAGSPYAGPRKLPPPNSQASGPNVRADAPPPSVSANPPPPAQ